MVDLSNVGVTHKGNDVSDLLGGDDLWTLNKTIERIEANREQTEASFVFVFGKILSGMTTIKK